jgi:hypothetical protein
MQKLQGGAESARYAQNYRKVQRVQVMHKTAERCRGPKGCRELQGVAEGARNAQNCRALQRELKILKTAERCTGFKGVHKTIGCSGVQGMHTTQVWCRGARNA